VWLSLLVGKAVVLLISYLALDINLFWGIARGNKGKKLIPNYNFSCKGVWEMGIFRAKSL